MLSKMKRAFIETISEFLIVIKKMGLPLIILGGSFITFSWMDGKPVVPLRDFIIAFLFLIIILVMFENTWLEKEINELKDKMKEIEETYKIGKD